MLSVIVPVYKVEAYLTQCLDSIQKQTYQDLEILLVDDGSPDHCGEICEKYAQNDTRFKVFHTQNQGLSAARNVGLRHAKGEWLSFVDSDDYLELDMFEMMVKALEESGADVSVCNFWIDSPSGKKIQQYDAGLFSRDEILEALLDEKINNNVWNKLYRRELFEDVSFPEGTNYEDIAILHRVLYKTKSVTVISGSFYHYRSRAESITKTYTAKNLLDYAKVHIERYKYYQKECPVIATKKKIEILGFSANGISKVWRWWHACSKDEKKKNRDEINMLKVFAKENIPFGGYRAWPRTLRFSSLFMRSSSKITFALLYYLNQLYRKARPDKSNIVEK